MTVTEVAVRDSAGMTLQTLTGDGLSAAMGPLAGQPEDPTKLQASMTTVVWQDVVLGASAKPPTRIDHSLTVSVRPGLPVPASITSIGATADVDTRTPTTIGPPLKGTGWIGMPSCCDGPHRRSLQPINNGFWLGQRFAIDFNKINHKGLLAQGDSNTNTAWFTYDQPVLAVADAKVIAAVDKFPDQIPNPPKPVDIEEADGNHVILELSKGVYAFYAHLKPGTLKVKAGDTVKKGQEITRTGNSGSSTATHLHSS